MNDFISAEELAAAQAAMLASKETVSNEPVVTEPVKTEPTTTEPIKTDPVVTTEPVKTEPVVTEPVKVEAPKTETVLSFDEQLEKFISENTGGKFKKFDEIKSVLDSPKDEFADENIKHWNELAKKGIKLDKDFFELQSLDLSGDENGNLDPEFVLLEAMKRKEETKSLSTRTLLNELNKKYDYSGWKDKDEADLTDSDLANREIMMRDAHKDLNYLIDYKKERTFVKELPAEVVQQQQAEEKQRLENFERFLDNEVYAKKTNLTIQIDEATKESFDYKLSEADRKDAINKMKLMATDSNVLLNQFAYTDETGAKQYHHDQIFEMIVLPKIYKQLAINAYNDGKAEGAKSFVKDELKNTSFKAQDGQTGNPVAATEQEALALALKASGQKII